MASKPKSFNSLTALLFVVVGALLLVKLGKPWLTSLQSNFDTGKMTVNEKKNSWAIYTDPENRFTISYPQDLVYPDVENHTSETIRFQQNDLKDQEVRQPSMGVTIEKNWETVETWMEEYTTYTRPNQLTGTKIKYAGVNNVKFLTINGKQAVQFESTTPSSTTQHTIFSEKGKIYNIYNNISGLNSIPPEVYQQFVESFKIVEPTN